MEAPLFTVQQMAYPETAPIDEAMTKGNSGAFDGVQVINIMMPEPKAPHPSPTTRMMDPATANYTVTTR